MKLFKILGSRFLVVDAVESVVIFLRKIWFYFSSKARGRKAETYVFRYNKKIDWRNCLKASFHEEVS